MLKVLQADKEYENSLKQYTKRDGILALILFVKSAKQSVNVIGIYTEKIKTVL